MSTHARIGIKNRDNTITSIYCHFDGYLEGIGKILNTHYKDEEKIRKLMELGDISCLGSEPIDDKEGWKSKRGVLDGCCLAYKSRGENTPAKTTSPDEFYYDLKCEYNYLFDDGRWLITGCLKGVPLSEVIEK